MSRIVLIVDDDPVQCRLTEAAVTRAGWSVRICTDGAAALGVLTRPENGPISVVLLDLVMEGGSGIGLLKEMRKAGVAVPVIVQTAQAEIDTVIEAMRQGARDYIVKPGLPERILAAIESAAHRTSPMALEGARDRASGRPPPPPSAPPPARGETAAAARGGAGAAREQTPSSGLVDVLDVNGDIRPLDEIEAEVIALAMNRYGGRPAVVARRMGIGRSTLYRKLRHRARTGAQG